MVLSDEFSILGWFSEINIQAAVIWPVVYGVIVAFTRVSDRKESEKATLCNLIQEIEDLAVEHWGSNPAGAKNDYRALKIQHKFGILARVINRSKKQYRAAENVLIEYRKAATDGDFESTDRRAVPFRDSRISLIITTAESLRETLGVQRSL